MFVSKTSGSPSLNLPRDTNFNSTTFLVHGDGTNGANNTVFLDSSSFNNTIVIGGNPNQGVFSPFATTSWSNYFNGTSDYLTISTNTNYNLGSNNFTIEGWIFPTSTASTATIFERRTSGGFAAGDWILYLVSAQLVFASYDYNPAGTAALTSSTITANVWTHFALVRNGATISLYINGVSIASTSSVNITDNTNNLTIGADIGSGIRWYFPGYISNLRIVNGIALYTSNFNLPTTEFPVTANTAILTCQSSRFIGANTSVSNVAVTTSGSPSVQPFSPFAPTRAYSKDRVSGSVYFNGSSDYLSLTSNALAIDTSNFTVEFWAYKLNAWSTGDQYIIDNGITNGMQIWVNTTAGTLRLGRFGVDFQLDYSYSSLTINTWNHFAFVRSGTSMALYVNGTRVTTATSSVSYASGGTQNIGRSTGGTGYWNGYISNLRVVNGTAVYDPSQTSITIPTAPLTPVSNTSLLLNATNSGIIDQTGKNNITTYGAAAVSTTQSKFGGSSIFFNGTNSVITAPYISSLHSFHLSDFTVELWVYPLTHTGMSHGVSNIPTLIGGMQYNNTTADWSFGMTIDGVLKFHYYNGAVVSVASGIIVPLNTWSHIAAVKTSSGISLYYNGTRAVGPTAISGTPSIQAGTTLTMGAHNNTYMNAYVDDVRISKTARYSANFTPPARKFEDR